MAVFVEVGKTSGWVGLQGKSGFLFGHVQFEILLGIQGKMLCR